MVVKYSAGIEIKSQKLSVKFESDREVDDIDKYKLAKAAFIKAMEKEFENHFTITKYMLIPNTPPCVICGDARTTQPPTYPEGVYLCTRCNSLFRSDAKV